MIIFYLFLSAKHFIFVFEVDEITHGDSWYHPLSVNNACACVFHQSLCVSAVKGGENFPSNALFVDYANLPEAIPEYVFPEHFGMAAEVDKVLFISINSQCAFRFQIFLSFVCFYCV